MNTSITNQKENVKNVLADLVIMPRSTAWLINTHGQNAVMNALETEMISFGQTGYAFLTETGKRVYSELIRFLVPVAVAPSVAAVNASSAVLVSAGSQPEETNAPTVTHRAMRGLCVGGEHCHCHDVARYADEGNPNVSTDESDGIWECFALGRANY